jgi:hypothetical protein
MTPAGDLDMSASETRKPESAKRPAHPEPVSSQKKAGLLALL